MLVRALVSWLGLVVTVTKAEAQMPATAIKVTGAATPGGDSYYMAAYGCPGPRLQTGVPLSPGCVPLPDVTAVWFQSIPSSCNGALGFSLATPPDDAIFEW